jgi:DnaJ like chaperone protein
MKYLIPVLLVIYTLSPYDLLPDFFVGWGWLDDLIALSVLWWLFFHKKGPRRRFGARQSYTGSRGAEGYSQKQQRNTPPREHTTKDPYAVLGVARNASPDEIKSAYRRLAGQYHPDKVIHLGEEFRELAEKRFKEIQEAYQELNPK